MDVIAIKTENDKENIQFQFKLTVIAINKPVQCKCATRNAQSRDKSTLEKRHRTTTDKTSNIIQKTKYKMTNMNTTKNQGCIPKGVQYNATAKALLKKIQQRAIEMHKGKRKERKKTMQ